MQENKYQAQHCHFHNLFCDYTLENTHSKTIEVSELLEEKRKWKLTTSQIHALEKDIIYNNYSCIFHARWKTDDDLTFKKERKTLIQIIGDLKNPSVNAVWF